jgi:sulfite reductase (NADPH) flavoprotein alpha-component
MTFWYFGYGSNMELRSLRAKGVEPLTSERAALCGWRLRFNVGHFFRHEGGVGNIEPSDDPSAVVRGVLHLCDDEHLALLDDAEAYGHGYDRIDVSVLTDRGEQSAVTYIGMPSFLDEEGRPTQRYLNILLKGATAAGLDPAYIDALRRHPVHQPRPVSPFVPAPGGEHRIFTAATLSQHPLFTALAGAVFDMSGARWQHKFLHGLFGGKDMTLFHLKRLDSSDGSETHDDIKLDRLTPLQRRYLNEYLHEYNIEYVYVGRYIYE